jgi:5-methylcytosine-specific restriction protein A
MAKKSQIAFINSLGLDAIKPTNYSWCAISTSKKVAIFSVWADLRDNEKDVILNQVWHELNGKVSANYKYARDAIKKIENEGFKLLVYKKFREDPSTDTSKTTSFEANVEERFLRKIDGIWYGYFNEPTDNYYPDDLKIQDNYIEGAKKRVTVNAYERDPKARQASIDRHGTTCKGCGFNFEEVYGEHGRGFIHVHHIKPIHTLGAGYELDPVEHLIPLCPNCHAMVHRGDEVLSIEDLKVLIKS